MAEDKEIHLKEILKTIEKYRIFHIRDIFPFYKRIGKSQFYSLFPNGSDELDTIKEAIDDNKVITKQSQLRDWAKSNNATLRISLFKLICTEEERKKLSMQYHDLKSEDGSMTPKSALDLNKVPTDVLRALLASQEQKENNGD